VVATSTIKNSQEIAKEISQDPSKTNFDIVNSMMKTRVKISQLEYLREHLEKLDKEIQYVNKESLIHPTLLESSVPMEEMGLGNYVILPKKENED
jgi:hypothetical protein